MRAASAPCPSQHLASVQSSQPSSGVPLIQEGGGQQPPKQILFSSSPGHGFGCFPQLMSNVQCPAPNTSRCGAADVLQGMKHLETSGRAHRRHLAYSTAPELQPCQKSPCAAPPHSPRPNSLAQAAVAELFADRDGFLFQESCRFTALLPLFVTGKDRYFSRRYTKAS